MFSACECAVIHSMSETRGQSGPYLLHVHAENSDPTSIVRSRELFLELSTEFLFVCARKTKDPAYKPKV